MKNLIIILALFLFCSCYSKRQALTALHNMEWANKQGMITDSLYNLHKKHHDIINNN